MRRLIHATIGLLLTASVYAPFASASYYVPKPHHACRAHYTHKTVRTRQRRHGKLVHHHGHVVWVKQARCYKIVPRKGVVSPKPPVTNPPVVTGGLHYSTRVDPTYTQDPTNPLLVTYAYSASAYANAVNLGAAGQLPDGVLNFYSPTTPGGPVGLICSLNVGGSTVGGDCPVTYSATGNYNVTTQYVPNTATAVTETDPETIGPYSTTTGATSHYAPAAFPQNGTLTTTLTVSAQGLGTITPAAGTLTSTITDLASGQSATWTTVGSQSCSWYVDIAGSQVQFQNYGSCTGPASTAWLPLADFTSGQVVVTGAYAGRSGWAGSSSQPIAADTP